MNFELAEAITVLERTPRALEALLGGLPGPWVECDEGPDTFSPAEVVGHLIHGERTDWMPRLRMIREHGESRTFEPFDRFAQRAELSARSLSELLAEFARLRADNLEKLGAIRPDAVDLDRTGQHPELGRVTLANLLSCWVVHDLSHVAQITRVMAGRYRADVGPWRQYLPILGLRERS